MTRLDPLIRLGLPAYLEFHLEKDINGEAYDTDFEVSDLKAQMIAFL